MGVDVFFVISGFLITGILLRGDIGLVEFYARRIRRIFPALTVVLASCMVVGWFVLFADEYAQLGKHTLASAGFVSNILLLNEVSYFDPIAESKPLLHMWSLGVEEQFYFILPAALSVLARYRLRAVVPLALTAVTSYLANVALAAPVTSTAYYLPMTRFWEMLIGSVLAGISVSRSDRGMQSILPQRYQGVSSFLGIALVLFSAAFFHRADAYPGHRALLPVIGTALVIAAGPFALANRMALTSKLAVGIGRISYPLYLWHWPLLAFAFILEGGTPGGQVRWALVGAALVLATLTHVLIERPVQQRGALEIAPAVAAACAVVACIGAAAYLSNGVKERQIAKLGQHVSDARGDWTYEASGFKDSEIVGMHVMSGRTDREVVVAGSSFMGQWWPRAEFIYQMQPRPTLTMIYASRDHCTPVPGNEVVSQPGNVRCSDYYDAVLRLARASRVDTLVLGGWWPRFYGADGAPTALARQFSRDLRSLVEAGKRVVLVANPPMNREFDPLVIASHLRLSGSLSAQYRTVPRASSESTEGLQQLRKLAGLAGAEVVNPSDYICGDTTCPGMLDGRPTFKDSDHVRAEFARQTGTFIDDIAAARGIRRPAECTARKAC